MTGIKSLADKNPEYVDLHISCAVRTRDRIDRLCAKYNVSRGVAIDALLDEHERANLKPHLPPAKGPRRTNRPGQGRKRSSPSSSN